MSGGAGDPVAVFAPAKLTLSLRIAGVRADGYHDIDAEMTTLDFGDRLEIVPGGSGVVMRQADGRTRAADRRGAAYPETAAAEATHLETTDAAAAHPETAEAEAEDAEAEYQAVDPICDLGDGDGNLVAEALRLASRAARVTVLKAIPVGAGLGGGSADAAAVLRWAGFTDVERSAGIGADVAFCLVGGRALVSGIGERVEPLPYAREQYTLLMPPVFCPTPAVYEAWDRLGGPTGPNGNDLEPAALCIIPELARWRDELGDATGLTPRLAGSGSTWFVPGAHPAPGLTVATTLPAEQ